MGRPSKPWFRTSKNSWFVTIDGKKVNLGRDKDQAFRSFHRMMADPGECPVGQSASMTVGELADEYLTDLRRRVGARTHSVAVNYLKRFLAAFGSVEASSLNRRQLGRWLGEQTGWSSTTANHVASRILAIFNWAVREDVMTKNPIKGLTKPRAKSRGTDAIIPPDAFGKLLEAAPEYLRTILVVLHETGARPCEVLTVTAADFHSEQRVWVIQEHKTYEATGRPRVVHLTARVVELCRRQADKYPDGPLFRTARGKPFPASYYLPRLVRDLRRKLGLPDSVIPYGLRHGFATDALEKGIPDALVAELLGHSGTNMLHRHYSHVGSKVRVLQEAVSRVR